MKPSRSQFKGCLGLPLGPTRNGVEAMVLELYFGLKTPKLQQISQVIQGSQVLWNLTNITSMLQQGKKITQNNVLKHFTSELFEKGGGGKRGRRKKKGISLFSSFILLQHSLEKVCTA